MISQAVLLYAGEFFLGGGAIQTITVILLKISEITVVFMVKDSYICNAKKDKQSFTMGAKIVYKSYNQNDSLLFSSYIGTALSFKTGVAFRENYYL